MSKVVIFGTGAFAEVVHFYLAHDSPHEVVAFCAHASSITAPTFQGLPVVPYETLTTSHPADEHLLFIAVGYRRMNRIRETLWRETKALGYRFVSYVSSRATNWASSIGDHCFIFEDNTLQPFTRIGDNVVLWSGNHIGHHSTVGDHCFIASHVVISGSVTIGTNCFIGVNATFRDGISVGNFALIGAGALIMGSVADKAVYAPPRTPASSKTTDDINF